MNAQNRMEAIIYFSTIKRNLVPRVLRLFVQRLVTRRASGELKFCLNFLIGYPVMACIVLL